MKSEFIGIAIGITQMVAIKMEQTKNGEVVNDSIVVERQGSLFEDCKRLIKTYSLEGVAMGIVALGERQDKIMILPRLPRIEVAEMLRWTVPEFVTWPEDSYYYDFVLEDMPPEAVDAAEQQLLYVVALQKQHITDLATGALKGGGNLKIIDAAPAPLTRRFVEKNGAVIGIVSENAIEFTGWYNGLCMSTYLVSLDMQAIISALDEMEVDFYSYGIQGIAGVQIYEDDYKPMKIETTVDYPELNRGMTNSSRLELGEINPMEKEMAAREETVEPLQWELIYEKYGRLTPIPFEEDLMLNTVASKQTRAIAKPVLWDMALGLAYRGGIGAKR
ncbi:hypothetical protein [Veillonella intestinalis]|uniref:hypothetical protein n=1 Tax=Veillonella intestinalis TaxID=2941341 RepID=UPI00203C25A8|nr:hypothetical protein [Veillonella intestinalis]